MKNLENNETVIDNATSGKSMMAESDKTGTEPTEAPSTVGHAHAESKQIDAGTATPSVETSKSDSPADNAEGRTTNLSQNTEIEPSAGETNAEKQTPSAKQVVTPISNKAESPTNPTPAATSTTEQAASDTADTPTNSEQKNNVSASEQVITSIANNTEVQAKAAPAIEATKRPFIDITPYLKLMVEREGSDMYFTCGARVQIKINGVSLSIGSNALPKGSVNDILPGILNEKQLAEFEEEMELDTAFSLDNVGRFRINVLRQRGEVALVIRQIKAQIPSVKELQLPQIIENLIMEPRGLLIIAGATGTGKSTTVASMIDHRNSRRSGHILTIEDPIEFIHDHKLSIVNQREVGLDTKSFKEALRRAMREAPDVIMIGEIRDAETMQQALSYADTGHLCIATLHATNTTQCMERIIGLFPETNRSQVFMDLSNNLRAIICQRLLVGIDKTRVPATEILLNEPMVRKLILEGSIHKLKELIEKAPPESPLHSFDNDMLRLYQAKKVTMEEALSHADEPDHFKLKISLGGGGISSSADDIYSV